MKKLFLLFSHKLTIIQEEDAKASLGIESFVALPNEMQNLWSEVPPDVEDLSEYLRTIRDYLKREVSTGDIVLVQGDFGATHHMVTYVHTLGIEAVYATTKRIAKEETTDDKIVKTSVFEHVRFRKY